MRAYLFLPPNTDTRAHTHQHAHACTRMHTHTHARTHARTHALLTYSHARTHTRTHQTQELCGGDAALRQRLIDVQQQSVSLAAFVDQELQEIEGPTPARHHPAPERQSRAGIAAETFLPVARVLSQSREFLRTQMVYRLVERAAGEGAASYRSVSRVVSQVCLRFVSLSLTSLGVSWGAASMHAHAPKHA